MITVVCDTCREPFEAQRKSRMYCSDKCRQRAWRQREVYDETGEILELLEQAAELVREGKAPFRVIRKLERAVALAELEAKINRLPVGTPMRSHRDERSRSAKRKTNVLKASTAKKKKRRKAV